MLIILTSADRSGSRDKNCCILYNRPGSLPTLCLLFFFTTAGIPVACLFALPYLRNRTINADAAHRSPYRVISPSTTAHSAKPEERPTSTEARQMHNTTPPELGPMVARVVPRDSAPYKTPQASMSTR